MTERNMRIKGGLDIVSRRIDGFLVAGVRSMGAHDEPEIIMMVKEQWVDGGQGREREEEFLMMATKVFATMLEDQGIKASGPIPYGPNGILGGRA